MARSTQLRGALVVELLKLFPSSVVDDVLEDGAFRERFGLSFDATIEFTRPGVSLKRSKLYPAIRKLFNEPLSSESIETTDGKVVQLSMEHSEGPSLFVTVDGIRNEIPPFWMLAPDQNVRRYGFEGEVAQRNLPRQTIEAWKEKIDQNPLSDDEVEELTSDLRLIPQEVALAIREEFRKPDGSVSVLVPRTRKYYKGLIGDRGEASTVEEYAAGTAKVHVERLLKWDFKRGLAQCLLFCANPRLSALIDISGRDSKEIEDFFTWLKNEGDLFSQIAGIEIGVRAVSQYPKIEAILVELIQGIRDDDTSDKTGRLALTANLFVFTDGELSRTRTFADQPPFWRRLAATAQASMIERALAAAGGTGEDSTEWAALRGRQFFMQTLTDLREEPRWIPDLMSAKQLRLELLMRARIAGAETEASLPEGPLRALLLGKESNQLEAITSVPSAYAPSPVEGGIDAPRAFPEDLLADLKAPHDGKAVEARVFASVVNFSQVFRFDAEIAGLIVSLLRRVKYRLAFEPDTDITFTLIMGLASIAASARHPELADEVRILTRVLVRRGELSADSEAQMRIALLACASRKDKLEWCKAVGDWLFEIANGKFGNEEAATFRAHVRELCHAVPELWQYTAKVDAAMACISD